MLLVSKGANSGFCRRYPIVIVGLKRDAPGRALGPLRFHRGDAFMVRFLAQSDKTDPVCVAKK